MNELEEAIELMQSGKLVECKSLLLDLLKLYPSNPTIWYQYAWVHDVMELEREAIPYYQKALELGLQGEERQGALLGLGSTYRTLGMYEQSKAIFEEAINEYPEQKEYAGSPPLAKSGGLIFHGRFDRMDFMQ
ncbi:tetratricopeptide repeat protein [Paenibacillus glacialis]|uniref:tetratricopeptide repeat protein n=1 Tax=Paenibacillus glacialis TaxID=494026 RepID=UPI000A003BB1|nr:tetratricopeptide repeat protein [Paenibacillus glacialis]